MIFRYSLKGIIFAKLIFRRINVCEFAIFENFAELTKSFFVIYLLFVPFLKYFWEINSRIDFSRN